jgi:hypothetical protein
MTNSRVKPIQGELMRFHVIGDSVHCTNCLTDGQPTLFPKVPWDEDEVLNACPYCRGKLERSEYLTDLSENRGIGNCSCYDFEMRCGPKLKGIIGLSQELFDEEVRMLGRVRCKHIAQARRRFLDEIIHKLAAGELKGVR